MVEERMGIRRIIIPELVKDELHIATPSQEQIKEVTKKKAKSTKASKQKIVGLVKANVGALSISFPNSLLS